MKNSSFYLALLFVLLAFLQIWLFNGIHLFGFATPLFCIYFLIKLPINMNRNAALFLSSLLGFVIDIFSGTLGLNMMVMTILGFLRFYLLKLFIPRDTFEETVPSFNSLGRFVFMRYAGVFILIQASLLYSIESFSLFTPALLLLRIAGSFILTFLLIFAVESVDIVRN